MITATILSELFSWQNIVGLCLANCYFISIALRESSEKREKAEKLTKEGKDKIFPFSLNIIGPRLSETDGFFVVMSETGEEVNMLFGFSILHGVDAETLCTELYILNNGTEGSFHQVMEEIVRLEEFQQKIQKKPLSEANYEMGIKNALEYLVPLELKKRSWYIKGKGLEIEAVVSFRPYPEVYVPPDNPRLDY